MTIINPQNLMAHLEGDRELLKDVFQIFVEEKPALQAQLLAAIEATDTDAVRNVAHSMKGMLANFLAESACTTAEEIQQIATQPSLDGIPSLYQRLVEQLDAVETELKLMIDSEDP